MARKSIGGNPLQHIINKEKLDNSATYHRNAHQTEKKYGTTGNLSCPKWLWFGIISSAIFSKAIKDKFLIIYHIFLALQYIKGHRESNPAGIPWKDISELSQPTAATARSCLDEP